MLPPGAMPMPPTCAAQRVGQVVAVQVRRRDDVEVVGPRQHLLERDVGDASLMTMPAPRLAAGDRHHGPPCDLRRRRRTCLATLVAPVAERALGELHDVALVHEGDALALVGDGVARSRRGRGARCPVARHRLDADADRRCSRRSAELFWPAARFGAEADLELLGKSLQEVEIFCASGVPAAHSMPA